ncbi:MAG: L,D-transpeptidase family protein [Hyphomicrobiales bacterium]
MRRVLFILFAVAVLAFPALAIWIIHPPALFDTVEARRASLPQRLAEQNVAMGQPLFIRIFKESSELEMWMKAEGKWRLFASYEICKWSGRLGPKLKMGDKQAPEGFYEVRLSSLNPNSRWHLSFNLGFPNKFDRAHGRTGSFLMVHGGCSSAGCYAMTNPAVDDIYRLTEAALNGGQGFVPVHIFPFRMTNEAMWARAGNKWFKFWQNLKKGYDAFEETRVPPPVKVAGKQYVIGAALTAVENQ